MASFISSAGILVSLGWGGSLFAVELPDPTGGVGWDDQSAMLFKGGEPDVVMVPIEDCTSERAGKDFELFNGEGTKITANSSKAYSDGTFTIQIRMESDQGEPGILKRCWEVNGVGSEFFSKLHGASSAQQGHRSGYGILVYVSMETPSIEGKPFVLPVSLSDDLEYLQDKNSTGLAAHIIDDRWACLDGVDSEKLDEKCSVD